MLELAILGFVGLLLLAGGGKTTTPTTPPKGPEAPWPKLTGTVGPLAYTITPQPRLAGAAESYAWELIGESGVLGSSAEATAEDAIRTLMEFAFEKAGPGATVTGVLGPYTFVVDQQGAMWRWNVADVGGGGAVAAGGGTGVLSRGVALLAALQWLIERGAAEWLRAPRDIVEPVQGAPAPTPPLPPLPTPEGFRRVGPWWILVRQVSGPEGVVPEMWVWAAFDPRDLETARELDEDDDTEGLGELARMTGESDEGDAALADATMWAEQHSESTTRRGLRFSPTCDAVTVVNIKDWIAWAAPQIRAGLKSGNLNPDAPMRAFVLLAAAAPSHCPIDRMTLSGRTFSVALESVGKALARWYDEEWWNQTPIDEFIASLLVGPPYQRVGTATLYKQHLIVTRPGPTGHLWYVWYGQRGFDDEGVLAGGESKAGANQAIVAAKAWIDQYGKFEVGLEGE